MKTCRFCGEKFTPPKQEPNIEPENLTHAVCQVVGGMIFEDVCEKEYCRGYAQHEADEFDAMRKGEL